ncbi:NB-ARC domain, LRR domain containing protein [Parasponia andersonii]|uniref:NB-ARC domain, LRR domain containing protein n=1 Tax=Parasponia andersonii TaxID=3476 RepID=A0A2P5CLN3_PARAD|nr:NB-ARC domain, LRR domain containing protein [Parasponia andersonii]
MAESVVSFLSEKLSSLLAEELNLQSRFRTEVVFVRDELDRIRAFLRAADAVEDEDEEIKVWVKQVREVAYDTEDILDDFLFRFEHRHRRDRFYGYVCKMVRAVKNLKARHRIASELQSIKTRVTTIAEGHQRYRCKLNNIMEIGTYSGNTAGKDKDKTSLYELRSDARLLEEAQLVGIDKPKQELISWLVEEVSEFQVVAVVGMGGLGKTTLVSRVYDDLEVKKHFQHHVWVTVSQSFKLDEILRQIVQQLFSEIKQPFPQGVDSTDNHILKTIIINFLRGKRYLLVLDDVWGVEAWDAIKIAFPNHNNGSRLLISTRVAEVASVSTKDLGGKIYRLKSLSLEQSWTLFCAKTFQGHPCPSHLEIICQNILKRCEGLPLAIVAIGGMLATKDINRIDEWQLVDRSLHVELVGNNRLRVMQEILSLSFNDLSFDLKYCFMYLSIFPEDYSITRNVLIRLWVGERFVKEKEGRSSEEVGECYFNELLNRSLIQADERYRDGRIKSCRVHDILREIILVKLKDQKFAAITSSEENRRLPDRVRRLSMHRGTKIDSFRDNDFTRLRSLLFFGEEDNVSSRFLYSFFDYRLRFLRVMDCSGASLSKFPEEITRLYHLRYLSLRNTDVTSVPRSIGKLQNLDTLDLKNTLVQELPTEILQLQCLRHLIIYRYDCGSGSSTGRGRGFKALQGIENLSSLTQLCSVEANRDGNGFLACIGKLTQLTRLAVLQLEAEHGQALCSSIEKLRNLRSLSLNSRTEDDILDLQFMSSSPPQLLQRLYLRGRLEKLPHWLPRLTNLATLTFESSMLQVDSLDSLQALPNLVSLRFHERAYGGETLCFKAGTFPMLREFHVVKAENLRMVTVEVGATPPLEHLMLKDCKLLKKMPPGIEGLRNLKSLGLFNMAEELIATIYRGSEDENYLRVMHIPSVYIGQVTDEGEFRGHVL